MARKISDIYNSIVAEKETQTELQGLLPSTENAEQLLKDITSTSKVAIWRLWAFVIAVATWTLENLFDEHKTEINTLIDNNSYGTVPWYYTIIKNWQYGDDLQWINNKWQYASIDASKQIIKRCSVNEIGNVINILVATENAGTISTLNTQQLDALFAYLKKIRPAGVVFTLGSYNSDNLKLYYAINYNPLIPLDTIKQNISDAVNNYLANITFGGDFNITKHTDAIQAAEGVIDPICSNVYAKSNSGTYEAVIDNYKAKSGWFTIDTDFPITTTFTYIPNNV